MFLSKIVIFLVGCFVGYEIFSITDTISLEHGMHVMKMSKDDPETQYYIGLSILENKGMENCPDPKDARYWIEKSANNGVVMAQLKLAWMYETGTGVEKDIKKAMLLYEVASNNAKNKLNSLNKQ